MKNVGTLCGTFTPIDSMSPGATVSQVNRVRRFVTISRAILVNGAGLAEIAQLLMLLIASVATLTPAVPQYPKRTARARLCDTVE